MTDQRHVLDEARAARDKARGLLQTLEASRLSSTKDLFKKVTGQSSLENSIAATRRLIESYDRIIGDAPATSRRHEPDPSPRARIGPMTYAALFAARTA